MEVISPNIVYIYDPDKGLVMETRPPWPGHLLDNKLIMWIRAPLSESDHSWEKIDVNEVAESLGFPKDGK